ncbi:hypothetical protein [Chenggangzhangella methanolivorans]|uniref:Uncharacterized protein n=1 Tax=Chenggangzhangella methanolivorans TaxID=1437009 RepID=A0A9E6UK83_9HYPH|nr:hypothetical protein [Chenggangzhangella methanolivorans]QZN98966.1 hypothetical protein K6K41_18990 [Chenggangzhangella methanolivorans]
MKRAGAGISKLILSLGAVASLSLSGCSSFAPERLYQDQIGYSESLGDSQKAQTLLNVVRLRYGDFPVFLKTTQVISGYSLQQTVGASLVPSAGWNSVVGTPGVTVGQTPTFTYQPVTGEALAQSFVRPLSPSELLPLTVSGIPVDVLFRLSVQSVNGLTNVRLLESGGRGGSSGFAKLLVNLRRLQKADLIGVRLDQKGGGDPKAKAAGRLMLTIAAGGDPASRAVADETRAMLGFRPGSTEAEVVYGRAPSAGGKVSVLTRSMLGVLSFVASEVEVSEADVSRGSTMGTASYADILRRPAVVVRSGEKAPKDAFSRIDYRGRAYWIENDDFDSKLAFSVIQMLMSLAETPQGGGPVVTVPAR